jgi:predicted anti-sigma-YlaC factor YlaD
MTTEKAFLEELARAPALPPQLYNSIRRNIRRNMVLMRTMLSLAATVVIAIGITAMLVSGNRSSAVISPEVASELQSIKDFGSGNDIPKDIETLVFYDGDQSD